MPSTPRNRTVSRLQPFASTIFAEMTALATLHDAVNLGQGFPDEDGPRAVLDAARDSSTAGTSSELPSDLLIFSPAVVIQALCIQ